jgi:queuosine precursor transporter
MQFLTDKSTRLFIILAGFFISNTLIAEFIGVKIFSLEATLGISPIDWAIFGIKGTSLTAGVILWPVVFVMTDIINEYYGTKGVRFLSYLSAGLISYGFLMVYAAIHLSPADWWQNSKTGEGLADMQLAFASIFGQGLWIIIGSLVAFFIGQLVDVLVFHKIKQATGEKWIFLRATGSTLISQFIDSFVVLYIAFVLGGNWTLTQLWNVGMVNYIYKFSLAVLLTPALYLVHFWIDSYLGKEKTDEMKHLAAQQD